MNETIQKFGYPETLIKEYAHWVVLLRPKQVTAGCLVLACKENAGSLPEVSPEAYSELPRVTKDLESCLSEAWHFDKINYLLLMMVDKKVHFHVIPRYSSPRSLPISGVEFVDKGWPKHPNLLQETPLTKEQFCELLEYLKSFWPET